MKNLHQLDQSIREAYRKLKKALVGKTVTFGGRQREIVGIRLETIGGDVVLLIRRGGRAPSRARLAGFETIGPPLPAPAPNPNPRRPSRSKPHIGTTAHTLNRNGNLVI